MAAALVASAHSGPRIDNAAIKSSTHAFSMPTALFGITTAR